MWTLLKWKANGEIRPSTAAEITAAEKADQAAKTARLREARLAKEAADRLANVPGEPAKAGKR
jgi:hypothetical protein